MSRRSKILRTLESLESRCLLAADLTGISLNEIVAANEASLQTRIREEPDDRFRGDMLSPDWIELRNASDRDVDLGGASLTDDPKHLARWHFPDGSVIPANGFLTVFASGLDIDNPELDESNQLHASFKLDIRGEYLAILNSEGVVADSIDDYPKLDADLAFGRDAAGEFQLLKSASPGAANADAFQGEVADTEFSVNRGFFSEAFTVELSTPTEGAEIRYTTDGSEPTASHGSVYSGEIAISTTTNLRAAAFKEGLVPTDVDTQTYVFVADVAKQPAEIAGFPFGGRVWAGQDTYVPQDAEMDPEIVNDPAYADIIDDALLAIPTMSITSEQDQIFGNDGWYDGEDVEGAVSVEILYPDDPESNQQINAGIESHSHDRLKRSLRLNFREIYGNSRFQTDFFQRSPVTGDSATDQFNAIILRGGNNRSWARVWNPDKTAYAIDEFFRSSQVAMSGYGMRGQVAHLYINGVYWGLYNPVERADQNFGAEYFGGDSDDWFTLNHGGDLAGNDDRWDVLRRMARDDMTVDENYQALREHLDVNAFIDYLVISWWTAVSDWPQNNYYGTNRNEAPNLDADPFRFVAWDGEWSWGQGGQSSRDGQAHVHADFRARRRGGQPIAALWHAARANPEFMTAFHDRVYKHLNGDGALTEENAQGRWTALTDMVREAVVAESARWGDSLEAARRPTRTRDGDWQREVDRIRGLIDGNNESFLDALRAEGFYPEFEPPEMLVGDQATNGGIVAPGTTVTLGARPADGIVYVAFDGADPRSPDGTVSPLAMEIAAGESIVIDRPKSVTIRTLVGETWSAANYGSFTTGQEPLIALSEIDFNPSDPSSAEVDAGLTDNDMFEFFEIVNTADHAVDLTGYHFSDGIDLDITDAIIPPNEIGVIVRNAKAFRFRYGADVPILGEFASSGLSNGGEKLTLVDPNGGIVFDGTYDDSDEWPDADGSGNSLQRLTTDAAFGTPRSWFAAIPTPGTVPIADTDLNDDGTTDAADVDFLCAQIPGGDLAHDLDGNGSLSTADFDYYISALLGTTAGDANLDGVFNSADLVTVFRSAEYEDSMAGNSGWADGDWNCDGDFTTRDLVAAFRAGAYIGESRPGRVFARDVAFSISTDEIDDDKELREFGNDYSAHLFAWIV